MSKTNKKIITPIIIAVLSFFVYTLNSNNFPTTDSIPNNLTAVNIIHNRRIDLTNFEEDLIKRDLIDISVKNNENKKIYSKTPILNGIISAPFFYLADKYFQIKNPDNNFILKTDYYQIIGKYYASFITALSIIFIYLTIDILFKNNLISIISTIGYSIGTFTLSTASQANWEHAPSLLLINITLYILCLYFKKNRIGYLLLITLLLTISYFIRPLNIIFIIALFIILIKNKKHLIPTILTFTTLYLLYKLITEKIGIPAGYSNEIIGSLKNINFFYSIKVFWAILFSRYSGILRFHPLFIISFLGIFIFIKQFINKKIKNNPFLLFSLLSIVAIFGLNSIWWAWTGGTSWGPRLLTEASPCLIIFFSFFLNKNKSKLFYIFSTILIFISLFNSLIAIYCNTTEWNDIFNKNKNQMQMVWSKPGPIKFYFLDRRSIFIRKLIKKNNQIILNKKTYLFIFKEKRIQKIYDSEDILI